MAFIKKINLKGIEYEIHASSADEVAWANITGKPSTFSPSSHTHTKSQITDFPTSMPASDVYSWAKASTKPSYSWSEITSKPSTFTPTSHTHTIANITNLQSTLDGKASSGHTHSAATTSTAGLMSASDKSKLDGIANGANKTTVDSALSSSSTNPVQNKVINTALAGKLNTSGGTVTGTLNIMSTQTNPLTLYRLATVGDDENVTHSLSDNAYTINYLNDETANSIDFIMVATDAETGDGTNVSESSVQFVNSGNKSSVIADTFIGALSGNAATATKLTTSAGSATQPVYFSDGKPVKTTYTLGASVPSGAKFTDTVYTHPTTSGNKHIPSGGSSGQILRWSADGTAVWGADNNTTYSNATTSAAGLMSASDKSKLDGITSSADSVSFSRSLTSGTKVGTITINGTGTDIYAPTNTDTHYTTGLKVGASATATANAQASNGSVYLNVLDNTTVKDSHKIVGSGATTVTSDANGVITISSTDNNTTYSAATTSKAGLMSASDKSKLDGIASGAEVNQNAFSNVVVGSTTIAADEKTDTLTLVAGSNVTLTPDATNDKVTIAAKDTTYSEATTSTAGLMSSSDKRVMDSVKDRTYVAGYANYANEAEYANHAYNDEAGNNIVDTYVPRYTPWLRAYSHRFIGTSYSNTFISDYVYCCATYKRLSPKSGVLSLNFTMPTNSESSCYHFINLSAICYELGITYAGGTLTDNGHWLCPQKTDLYNYGTSCRVELRNDEYFIQLGRYYDSSGDVGAWAKSNFSGCNVQVMDVYIQEA